MSEQHQPPQQPEEEEGANSGDENKQQSPFFNENENDLQPLSNQASAAQASGGWRDNSSKLCQSPGIVLQEVI